MAETDFKYDVFVSYNSANKEWVRKVFVPTLEKAGLRVYEYYRDFEAGAPIVTGIETAILESHKTISILSPGYLKSEWTEFESLMVQALGPANRDRRFLPVILEACEVPPHIKFINCINFANPDDMEMEWQRLSKALGVTLSPPIDTPPDTGTRGNWHLAHPYPMPPNFTGRAVELKMLDDWLADDKDRLFILRALGGFGKSALAWQWVITHVNPTEWTKLVWWSFYEGDASFEHFIEETLKYLKLEVPQGQRPQVDALLKAMQSQKILLVMDGFERALRAYSSMNAAYRGDESLTSLPPQPPSSRAMGVGEVGSDCVNINAEVFLKSVCSLPNIKGKVLMTTRLTPRAVKPRGEFMLGCREEELTSMQPADAVEFFHKQKIKGTHTEIEAACAPYGYHPLSLRLLAGRIVKDFENPADIIVAQKLKIDGDIIQQKYHVLEVSYNNLPPQEQKLLSTITCFRSTIELKTLRSITDNTDTLDNDLHDLVERGLLHFDEKNKKFNLHPIVRRYAYEQLDKSERLMIHLKLKEYFTHMLSMRTTKPVSPKSTVSIDDLQTAIEIYHHTSQMGFYDDAFRFYHDELEIGLHYLGAYSTIIELLSCLFSGGEETGLLMTDQMAQVRVLHLLAVVYSRSGNPMKAIELFELELIICKNLDDIPKIAVIMRQLAYIRLSLGNFLEAEKNLQYGITELSRIDVGGLERGLHRQRGILLAYTGRYTEAKDELSYLPLNKSSGNVMSLSFDLARYSLLRKEWSQVLSKATAAQRKAYKRHSQGSLARSEMLIGAALLGLKDLVQAEHHLGIALENCRNSNIIDIESETLLFLASLRYHQNRFEEAKSLADEALLITERCGYVLQGADVNLFLAQYALEQEQDKVKAKEYAEEALNLATCDGPPYYYKVAYEEAERFLARLQE